MSTESIPSAIVFDLDGTLIDTYHLYLESYRRGVAPFVERLPELAEVTARRPSSERRFLANWVPSDRLGACRLEVERHYAALHPTLFGGVYDGIREMLAALRAAGVPLALVTGKGAASWAVTEGSVLLNVFPVVVTDDDVQEPKPDPEGLFKAAAELRVATAEAVYIGDSLVDMEAGRRSGMKIGAALWSKTDAADRAQFIADVASWRPDWMFERPADVTRLFASWC